MSTGFESALVKPVVDGILGIFKGAKTAKLKANAEVALAEAIRELLLAPNDLKSPEVKIAIAKAAGIMNTDLLLAEEMLQKHRVAAKKPAAKKPAAKKPAAKKPAAKKPAAKKAAAKKPAAKKPAAR
jgi:hypothetical protein